MQFRILRWDIGIAEALKEMNLKYDSLKNIFMYFAKDTNEDIVKITEY